MSYGFCGAVVKEKDGSCGAVVKGKDGFVEPKKIEKDGFCGAVVKPKYVTKMESPKF